MLSQVTVVATSCSLQDLAENWRTGQDHDGTGASVWHGMCILELVTSGLTYSIWYQNTQESHSWCNNDDDEDGDGDGNCDGDGDDDDDDDDEDEDDDDDSDSDEDDGLFFMFFFRLWWWWWMIIIHSIYIHIHTYMCTHTYDDILVASRQQLRGINASMLRLTWTPAGLHWAYVTSFRPMLSPCFFGPLYDLYCLAA